MIQITLVHCSCGHISNAHALNFGRIRLRCLVQGCACERFALCLCGRDTPLGQGSAHPEAPAGFTHPEG